MRTTTLTVETIRRALATLPPEKRQELRGIVLDFLERLDDVEKDAGMRILNDHQKELFRALTGFDA